jgi:hypothetical protein
MRLVPLLATALSVLLSVPVFAQAQEWIDFSSKADFFTINFPAQPSVTETTYESEYSLKLPARVYRSDNGPNHYTVTVVDYNAAEKLEAERVKKCQAAGGEGDLCNDHTRAEIRGAMIHATWLLVQKSAKLTHLSYSNADRVEGHEIYLTNTDGSRTIAAVYMHENRLYIIEGNVPAKSPPPAIFYQSMGFIDREGKRIRYDTPYSNGFPAPRRVR